MPLPGNNFPTEVLTYKRTYISIVDILQTFVHTKVRLKLLLCSFIKSYICERPLMIRFRSHKHHFVWLSSPLAKNCDSRFSQASLESNFSPAKSFLIDKNG